MGNPTAARRRLLERLNFPPGAKWRVILDRMRGVCNEDPSSILADVPGLFRIQSRRIARSSGRHFQAYERAEWFHDHRSDMKISLESQPTKNWIWPYRITLVADDATGLFPSHVFRVMERLPDFHLVMLEVAFDFAGRLTRREARQRVLFGKTRPSPSRGYADYWGRRSDEDSENLF
jgi:hypothetical protein